MKQYFFGYLFVKLAHLLAGLVLFLAVLACVFEFWQAGTGFAAAQYQPNDVLPLRLKRVASLLNATRSFISRNLPDHRVIELPDFGSFYSAHTSSEFAVEKAELAKASACVDQLKASVTEEFEASILALSQKLRTHASTVHAMQPSPTPSPAQSSPPTAASPVQSETLFSPKVDAEEIKSRRSTLAEAQLYLEGLVARAEDPANKDIIGGAVKELILLQQLLNSYSAGQVASVAPTASSSVPGVAQTAQPLNAEKVASELDQLSNAVKSAILSSWSIDDALDRATETLSVEAKACRDAEYAQKKLWLASLVSAAMTAGAAIAVAFLVLVTADITQTLLDTATNTREIADRTGYEGGVSGREASDHGE